jgi:nitrogen fixation-related uncharacterized protein
MNAIRGLIPLSLFWGACENEDYDDKDDELAAVNTTWQKQANQIVMEKILSWSCN